MNDFFTKESLLSIYEEYIKHVHTIGIDKTNHINFDKNKDSEIDLIYRKISENRYRFTAFKEKLILTSSKKPPRIISIPTIRDRIVLKALSLYLKQEFKEKIIQEIPQIKINELNKALSSNKYSSFVKTDIVQFYPSINHEKLLIKVNEHVDSEVVRVLIKNAIENDTKPEGSRLTRSEIKGIPQGLSISNILSEIYLLDFDVQVGNLNNVKYFRYVDDILVLLEDKSKVDEIFSFLENEMDNLCLKLANINESSSKSMKGAITQDCITPHFRYLGYEYQKISPTIPLESRYKFEGSIANIFTRFKYSKANHEHKLRILEWRLNLRITGCIFEGKKRGWLFYYSQSANFNLIFSIKYAIINLKKRFLPNINLNILDIVDLFSEIKKAKLIQVPNFDKYTDKEKRKVLKIYLADSKKDKIDSLPSDEIDRLFKIGIRRVIQELETDISKPS